MTSLAPLGVDVWPTVTLDQLDHDAALQTRVDRKYAVTRAELASALDAVGGALAVLEIAGERAFAYRSTYFDTPDLISYRAAATGRSRRFKVRTRAYASIRTAWLEVKLRDPREQTDKYRVPHEHEHELELDGAAAAFLGSFEPVRPHLGRLAPTITTTYERTTLLCTWPGGHGGDGAVQRVTIDADVTCRRPDGTALAGFGEHLVVETKSRGARPGAFDRALWGVGARPLPISKYAIGVASARPDLVANRWRRVLSRYVRPVTDGSACHLESSR